MSIQLRGTRVAITGANGFIGSATVRRLVRAGARVSVLIGPPPAHPAQPLSDVSSFHGDITDRHLVAQLVAGADVVVHLAGPSSVAGSFDDPVAYVRIHTLGTTVLLDACRHAGVRRFVYVSSAEVYGRPPGTPVGESHPAFARSPYGAAKIGAEAIVQAVGSAGQINAIILRPFSIYGPGLSPRSLIGTIARQVNTADAIALCDLRPVRDYCFVDDLVDAVVRACSAGEGIQVLNIGTGRGTSVADLALTMMDLVGRRVPLIESDRNARPRDADLLFLVADPRRAGTVLGWRPTTSLADGLSATLQWTHELSASS